MVFRSVLACLLVLPSVAAAQQRHAVEGTIGSINSKIAAELTFVNQSGRTIKVYWLDYGGTRKHYRTLAKGESYVQQTFVSHPWVVTDEDDNAWYVYFPEGQPRTILIAPPH
jgi:hypothetical protein